MKILLIFALFLAAVAHSLAAEPEIRIGISAPLSGSSASVGQAVMKAATKAVEDLNGQGGVLGRRLSLIVVDDSCDSKRAFVVANRLANERIDVVIGPYCQRASYPAANVYAEEGILQIAPMHITEFLKQKYRSVLQFCDRSSVEQVSGDNTISAIQAFVYAVDEAGSTRAEKLVSILKKNKFETKRGIISFEDESECLSFR